VGGAGLVDRSTLTLLVRTHALDAQGPLGRVIAFEVDVSAVGSSMRTVSVRTHPPTRARGRLGG